MRNPTADSRTLVIDTATDACSAALFDGGRLLRGAHELVGRGHAERLIPMIRDLLQGCTPQAVLVGCGPGSFTGIRIGIAAARALGLAWRVPVAGFETPALIACGVAEEEFAVAMIGGHGELFVQPFAGGKALAPVRSLKPEAAASLILAESVYGSGASALIQARGYGRGETASADAAQAASLPAAALRPQPSPVYGREADAKVPA